jgi:hypothetical protein
VKGGGVSSSSFLGGFRAWGLSLAVQTTLREVVLIWLASQWGEMLRGFSMGSRQMSGLCRGGKTGLELG